MRQSNQTGLIMTLIIIIFLFIIAIIYAVFLYIDLNAKRTAGFEETVIEILNQTPIKEVTAVEQYNGDEAYHVVYGVNEDQTEKIIFYPLAGDEKTLITIDAAETISEEEMKSLWAPNCNQCEFVDITPALVDEAVLWELVYYDADERYTFDYRSIYDGTDVDKVSFQSKFN